MGIEKSFISNRKFGIFLSLFSFLLAGYLYFSNSAPIKSFTFISIGLILLLISLTLPAIFKPFRTIWLQLGKRMGDITSPLIIGAIFFGIFAPIGFFLRFFKRNDSINEKNIASYWIAKDKTKDYQSFFKDQF